MKSSYVSEWQIIYKVIEYLVDNGYCYMDIPSMIRMETIERQEIPIQPFCIDNGMVLSGSAEQGILETFTNVSVNTELAIVAFNQCFRREYQIDPPYRCEEFKKVEQFIFTYPENYTKWFETCLSHVEWLCNQYNLTHRRTDQSTDDGYHLIKIDVEVLTRQYGWMEIASCSYFGDEQMKRFDIKGKCHTISCTGVALPRFLVPIMERQ